MTIVIAPVKQISCYLYLVAKSDLREAVCAEVVRILRETRITQGISMEVLASRAGLSQSMISLTERDLRNPTLDTLLRMAEVLDVDLAAVLTQARKRATKAQSRC